jgi:hypothetical protein
MLVEAGSNHGEKSRKIDENGAGVGASLAKGSLVADNHPAMLIPAAVEGMEKLDG